MVVIDIGASLTLFSFEMWEHLGFPNPCNDNIVCFDDSTSCCLGAFTCKIKTQYSAHSIRVRFLPLKMLYTPSLLGLDWCHISDSLLSPSTNIVSFQTVNGVKSAKLVATTLQPPPANLDELQTMKTSKQNELPQPPITQGQSNANIGTRKGTPHKWVNVHAAFAKGPRHGEHATWRVRKELTNAQG